MPFDGSELQKFQIFSDLTINPQDPTRLVLVFRIHDELAEVDLAHDDFQFLENQMQRKDELWKMTCFEMFLNPVGHKRYFEFNFNLEGAWNAYQFAGYRFPQPPQASSDFKIESMTWKMKQLEIVIKNETGFEKFNVGLTAVIKNKKNQTTYFALKHEGGKPDFHLASGFALPRG